MEPTKKVKTSEQNKGEVQALAPIQTEKIDENQLIEEYKQLITYKQNYLKLQTIIKLEQDKSQLEELQNMEREINQAIMQQEETIKQSQNNDYFKYNTDILQEEHVGRLAKVQYQQDNKWYHAVILQLDQHQQQADIQFIGYKDILNVHSIYVKLMKKPDYTYFQEGTQCECIYSDDGRYHPCVIEKVLDNEKYIVKYDKKEIKEQVTLCHLRESKKNTNQGQKKRTFEDLTEFKVPENLKILPNDNEKQKSQKKNKIKALKQQFKQAVLEKEAQEKQNKWNNFKKQKKQNNNSIFSTTDRVGSKVGVMNSGKGMTGFGIKDRLKLEDNSHLSRQF